MNSMAYQYKPELAQKATFNRPNIFRVSDNEIYMIKDSNLKKINDILKYSSQTRPSTEGFSVDKDIERHNKNMVESMKTTSDLFREIFELQSLEDYFKSKIEIKYGNFKKHLKKVNRKERLQKVINSVLNENKSMNVEEHKESQNEIKKEIINETINNNDNNKQ